MTETTEPIAAFHDRVWAQGDLEAIDELFTADCVVTDNNQTLRGPRALKDATAGFRWAFPDVTLTVDDSMLAPDGRALVRWHAEGTHLGDYQGIEPAGTSLSYWGISVFRLESGRIAESWIASTLPEALDHLRAEAKRTL
ncbi:MAG: ester cyclase [Actinomycetota bacterium]